MSVDDRFFDDSLFGDGLYRWCSRRNCHGLVYDYRLLDRGWRCGDRTLFDDGRSFDRGRWFDIDCRIDG